MNKDVIYLEPEDDITDILTKLQQAGQKVVAIVPPKKATMLRSAVNMKLVARVAKECDKIAVIVTTDPAIVKMAMTARIPVAKTLQSRPVIPTEENVKAAEADIQIIDENGDISDAPAESDKNPSKSPSKASDAASEGRSKKSADTLDLTEEALENGSEGPKKDKKANSKASKTPSDKKVPSLAKYQKWLKIGIPVGVLLVIFLVWAFVFAPSATITVAISSTPSNFSETVKFTTDQNAENLDEGVFYAEKQSIEQKYTTDFTATGEEDRGEKATGKVTVTDTFRPSEHLSTGYGISVPVGTKFVSGGKEYISVGSSASRTWDSDESTFKCDNMNITTPSQLTSNCQISVTVNVEAAASGTEYNISSNSEWSKYQGATVTNSDAISGGTTDIVKTVSRSDVDSIRDAQLSEHTPEGREMLLDDISDDVVVIESSFTAEAGDVNSTPGVGDVVGDNTKPNVVVNAIYSVYTVERSKIEEYINKKVELGDDQRIYSIGNPYFERFTNIDEDARLKTTIETGPTVDEEAIFERAKGRKTGEVQSQLRSINGVSSVEIRTPFFWVWSIPNDRSKVTIDLTVEDDDKTDKNDSKTEDE